ncbi:MAG: DUF4123 domain-containing protein [Desulfobacter sp.]|nr:MAG: DUF4123 domain-containing protein [Desulfobacter sp.]
MASVNIDKIVHQLWPPVEGQAPLHVYALVDAARSESIYPKLSQVKSDCICLHRGDRARELAWVSPYLARVREQDPFFRWLLEEGWGKSRATFVRSRASLNELVQHFRTCLTVYDEKGKSYFFRFYDPRVLRTYLPICNEEELNTVFGPAQRFIVEDADPSVLLNFHRAGNQLQQDKVSLS